MDKEQLSAIIDRLDDLHRCLDRHVLTSESWRDATDKRLDVMQKELTRNTEVTESARGAYKVLQVIGGIAAVVAPIVFLWQSLMGDKTTIGPLP
jgi:hypothetical protein